MNKTSCKAAKETDNTGIFALLYYAIMILCLIGLGTSDAEAVRHKKRGQLKSAQVSAPLYGTTTGSYVRSPPAILVVDVDTGKILESTNGKTAIYPASLTKLMTVYLVFEAIEAGKLSMDDYIPVSQRAAHVIPLKLGLRAGQTIKVRDAVNGTIIHSANDAAIVLGEKIGVSEENFAILMTKRAHSLGMKDTQFMNAAGFHHSRQKTTPIDLAKLTMALERDFPQYYSLFKQTSFEFAGRTIRGHNRVTENYAGVEFGKTGFTSAAGCNLVTVAERGDKRLVGIVTGSKSSASRNQKMMSLLDKHFGVITMAQKQPVHARGLKLVKHKVTKNPKIKAKRTKRA